MRFTLPLPSSFPRRGPAPAPALPRHKAFQSRRPQPDHQQEPDISASLPLSELAALGLKAAAILAVGGLQLIRPGGQLVAAPPSPPIATITVKPVLGHLAARAGSELGQNSTDKATSHEAVDFADPLMNMPRFPPVRKAVLAGRTPTDGNQHGGAAPAPAAAAASLDTKPRRYRKVIDGLADHQPRQNDEDSEETNLNKCSSNDGAATEEGPPGTAFRRSDLGKVQLEERGPGDVVRGVSEEAATSISGPATNADEYQCSYLSPLESYQLWLSEVRQEAERRGVRQEILDAAFARVTVPKEVEKDGYKPPAPEAPEPAALEPAANEAPSPPPPSSETSPLAMERRQPELLLSVREYVMALVPERVWAGVDALIENRELLDSLHRKYGVQPEIIVALWGIESSFGNYMGDYHVVDSLAHLAYLSDSLERQSFFRTELLIALDILNEGHVEVDRFVGSWAGALGQPQFMPSSFQAYAVDYDGDGRSDIWGSTADSLASIAYYLKENGWKRNKPYGVPVELPEWELRRSSRATPGTSTASSSSKGPAPSVSPATNSDSLADFLFGIFEPSSAAPESDVPSSSLPNRTLGEGVDEDQGEIGPTMFHEDEKRFREWRGLGLQLASALPDASLYLDTNLTTNTGVRLRLQATTKLKLIRPVDGFAFLAGPNYEVIKTYNRSTCFAVAVATLAHDILVRAPLPRH